VFRYPTITDRPFEALWALANVGMIANIAVWLSIKVGTPRLALIGGVLAILGHLIRVAVSLGTEARPNASVDTPIIITIRLMFIGLALPRKVTPHGDARAERSEHSTAMGREASEVG
jgi:hypothetical protein